MCSFATRGERRNLKESESIRYKLEYGLYEEAEPLTSFEGEVLAVMVGLSRPIGNKELSGIFDIPRADIARTRRELYRKVDILHAGF